MRELNRLRIISLVTIIRKVIKKGSRSVLEDSFFQRNLSSTRGQRAQTSAYREVVSFNLIQYFEIFHACFAIFWLEYSILCTSHQRCACASKFSCHIFFLHFVNLVPRGRDPFDAKQKKGGIAKYTNEGFKDKKRGGRPEVLNTIKEG